MRRYDENIENAMSYCPVFSSLRSKLAAPRRWYRSSAINPLSQWIYHRTRKVAPFRVGVELRLDQTRQTNRFRKIWISFSSVSLPATGNILNSLCFNPEKNLAQVIDWYYVKIYLFFILVVAILIYSYKVKKRRYFNASFCIKKQWMIFSHYISVQRSS